MIRHLQTQLGSRLMAFCMGLLFLLLSACGGGNAGTTLYPGSGGTTGSGSATIALSLSTTSVSTSTPATVKATFTDSTGKALANQVIVFSFTTGGFGQFSAASALTDSNGVASVVLSPASTGQSGADNVIATGSYNGKAVVGTQGFQSSGSGVASASLAVSLSATSVSSQSGITVIAVLKDGSGLPIANQVVSFTLGGKVANLSAASALTDATGTASTVLTSAGSGPGADTVTASVGFNGKTISNAANFQFLGTSTTSASLRLSLSSTTVTAANPVTVTAVLKDGSGTPIAGQVVGFSTLGGKGSLSATTALTDSTGTAAVTLSPASATSTAADSVSASVNVGGQVVSSNSVGFQLTATNVTIASFTSDVPSGSALAANGQSILTVKLAGTVSTTPVQLTLLSQCASFSPAKATVTPATITTTTGVATFSYLDKGCGAVQTVDNLQVSIAGTTQSQSLTLSLTSPSVASITFVSATPSLLYLSTSGYPPTNSTVIFQVNDGNGNGLPNKTVVLTPTTTIGGLTMDGQTSVNGVLPSVTKTTDSNGQVRVLVNSGTVPTPVAIRATYTSADGTSQYSSVSANLSIAVGLPTQSRFSIAGKYLSIEAYNQDNIPNTYTVILADRLGNPVPPTTVVNFVNTMGQVLTASTTGVSTSISAVSAGSVSGGQRPPKWDGRVTTMAYANGEESFLDLNGTNVYASNDDYQDLGDPYLDPKFRGFYDPTLQTISYGATGSCYQATTAPFMMYDGTNGAVGSANPGVPSKPGTCSGSWGKSFVRAATQTVWSTSAGIAWWGQKLPANYYVSVSASCPTPTSLITGYQANTAGTPVTTQIYPVSGSQLYNMGTTGVFVFSLADANAYAYNPMAYGTTVSAQATTGLTATVTAGGTVGNTSVPSGVAVSYSFTPPAVSGTVTLTFTSPSGVQSSATVFLQSTSPPTDGSGNALFQLCKTP